MRNSPTTTAIDCGRSSHHESQQNAVHSRHSQTHYTSKKILFSLLSLGGIGLCFGGASRYDPTLRHVSSLYRLAINFPDYIGQNKPVHPHVFDGEACRVLRPTHLHREIARETQVEWLRGFDFVNLLIRQLHTQRLDVAMQVVDLADSYNWENIRRLVHDVRQRDGRDLRSFLLRQSVQYQDDTALLFRLRAHLPPFAIGGVELLFTLEGTSTKRTPRTETHALRLAHGQDLSFKVASGSAPKTLIDTELRQAMVAGVCGMSTCCRMSIASPV